MRLNFQPLCAPGPLPEARKSLDGPELGSAPIIGLAPQQSATETFAWPGPIRGFSGSVKVCALADADDLVVEFDECNNTRVAMIELLSLGNVDCNTNAIADACEAFYGLVPDCNTNSVPDSCDLANGALNDIDSNGLPDECAIKGDFDNDGLLEVDDHAAFAECLNGPALPPDPALPVTPSQCMVVFDFDWDNDVDLADWRSFQGAVAP